MTTACQFPDLDLDGLERLARPLSAMMKAGDMLALSGDIGTGKTAFARSLIRNLAGDDRLEVPSPAFALHQRYLTPRMPVSHFDFYRLSDAAEVAQLGVDEAFDTDLVIVEWPERLGQQRAADCLELRFHETAGPGKRSITASGYGRWQKLLPRLAAIVPFVAGHGWGDASFEPFPGDASVRVYYRLRRGAQTALLMDWPRQPDGPPIRDGKPYSRIAHLAEGVGPFVAVAGALRSAGVSAPELFAADLQRGLLLIEDFGDAVFAQLARDGMNMMPLYAVAVDALLHLRRHPPAANLAHAGCIHNLHDYDSQALAIETGLLLDWYLPFIAGQNTGEGERRCFAALWDEQFGWLQTQPYAHWVLRDFHSPNLLWRERQAGLAQLGIIDFQDAMRGHAAYDLVSLLQDARIDVAEAAEQEFKAYYCDAAASREPDFDRSDFLRAYAVLGAQRNTKILGIFARLAKRDGKIAYLQHMPRVAAYLQRNLDHPALAGLKQWYLDNLPGLQHGLPGKPAAEISQAASP